MPRCPEMTMRQGPEGQLWELRHILPLAKHASWGPSGCGACGADLCPRSLITTRPAAAPDPCSAPQRTGCTSTGQLVPAWPHFRQAEPRAQQMWPELEGVRSRAHPASLAGI